MRGILFTGLANLIYVKVKLQIIKKVDVEGIGKDIGSVYCHNYFKNLFIVILSILICIIFENFNK